MTAEKRFALYRQVMIFLIGAIAGLIIAGIFAKAAIVWAGPLCMVIFGTAFLHLTTIHRRLSEAATTEKEYWVKLQEKNPFEWTPEEKARWDLKRVREFNFSNSQTSAIERGLVQDALPTIKKVLEDGKLSLEDIGSSDRELAKLERKSQLLLARNYLAELRSAETRPESYDRFVKIIRKNAQEFGFSLRKAGTNARELAGFLADHFQDRAEAFLRDIKRTEFSMPISDSGRIIRESMEKAKRPLSALGITEDKLVALEIQFFSKWIQYVEETGDVPGALMALDPQLKLIRKLVSTGRFTFAQLGTSEEGLLALRQNRYLQSARTNLERLREGDGFVEDFLRHVKEAGCSLENLGTSEQEMETFRQQEDERNRAKRKNVYNVK